MRAIHAYRIVPIVDNAIRHCPSLAIHMRTNAILLRVLAASVGLAPLGRPYLSGEAMASIVKGFVVNVTSPRATPRAQS